MAKCEAQKRQKNGLAGKWIGKKLNQKWGEKLLR
jgi:hypothetical protein